MVNERKPNLKGRIKISYRVVRVILYFNPIQRFQQKSFQFESMCLVRLQVV